MKEQTILFPIPKEVMLNSNVSINHRVKGLKAKALRLMGANVGKEIKEHTFTQYKVDILVYPPTKRRIDPPNLYPTVKPLIDGLTDANLWADDDFEHMTEMSFRYGGVSELSDIFIIEMKIKGDVIK